MPEGEISKEIPRRISKCILREIPETNLAKINAETPDAINDGIIGGIPKQSQAKSLKVIRE